MGNRHPNYSHELAHDDQAPVWASHEPRGYVCPFCQLAAGTADDPANRCELSDMVYQDEDVLVFIACDGFGPHAGHAMITPAAHREAIYDLTDDQLTKISIFSRHVALATKLAWNSPGTSVRQHNEPAGNQHVWHYHLHVFPRFEDDMLYRQIRHPLEVEFRAQKARELKSALDQVLAAAG